MMSIVYGTVAAAVLLAVGWLASAWFYKRQLAVLQLQLKVVRQTATEHGAQARRQIGQLQAELALRPAPVRSAPDPAEEETTPHRRRSAVPDKFVVLEDGFPQTAIVADGYAPTQLMR